MTTDNEQTTLEPCPWCKAAPVLEQSLQPRWFHLKHGEYCVMALNEFGRGRTQYIEMRFAKAWNTRVSAASTAPVVDEDIEKSAAFVAYNQAIEDALAAIRAESQGGGYWAAAYINAVARRCSPHVYATRAQAARDTAYADGYNDGFRQGRQSRAAASPAAPQEDALIRREIRSSRHPHFTHEDHQRMKEAVDSLSDCPTEEEAEAVLQACGTSGKEVVNDFIERLLRENLELKQRLETPAPTPSQPARDAAREIIKLFSENDSVSGSQIAAIISRHLPAAAETVGEREED